LPFSCFASGQHIRLNIVHNIILQQFCLLTYNLRQPTIMCNVKSLAWHVDLGLYLDRWPRGKTGWCEPVPVRRCGPQSVTDRLYICPYRADTNAKWFKPKSTREVACNYSAAC